MEHFKITWVKGQAGWRFTSLRLVSMGFFAIFWPHDSRSQFLMGPTGGQPTEKIHLNFNFTFSPNCLKQFCRVTKFEKISFHNQISKWTHTWFKKNTHRKKQLPGAIGRFRDVWSFNSLRVHKGRSSTELGGTCGSKMPSPEALRATQELLSTQAVEQQMSQTSARKRAPSLFFLMETTKVCWFVDGLVMVDGDVIFFHESLKICFSKNVNCCDSGSQEMDGLQMMSIRRSAPWKTLFKGPCRASFRWIHRRWKLGWERIPYSLFNVYIYI